MKYINIILLMGLVLFLFSCDKGDERSTLTNVQSFSVDSVTTDATSVPEESATHTVNFSVDENQIIEGLVSIEVGPNSTATEGVDFILGTNSVSLDPYVGAGSFTFDILPDILLEGDEVIEFIVSASAAPYFQAQESMSVMVTIEDFLTDDLFLTFDWEGTFVFDGDTYNICPFVDLDVYVLDADGNDLGIYDAATGACPETMNPNVFDDGTYYLASNMWDNSTLQGLGLDFFYNMKVIAYRQGKIDFSYDVIDNWYVTDLDQANDGNADFKEVCNLTKAGDVFTIEAPDGTVLGSGATAPRKSEFQ